MGSNASGGMFTGVIPALFTPFNEDESINERALRDHVEWLVGHGVQGLFVCGSSGEGPLMSPDERRRVVELVVEQVAGRVPVMVHVGTADTRTAVALAKHAASVRAAAVSSVPPYYYAPDVEAAFRHWRAIGEATDLPLFVYHIPKLINLGSLAPFLDEVLKLPHIAGLKFTDTDYHQMLSLIDMSGGRLIVLSGYDEDALAGLAMGASGIIGTTYNILPEIFIGIYRAVRENRLHEAHELQRRLNPFFRLVLAKGVNMHTWKVLGEMRGLKLGRSRRPFEYITGAQREALEAAARRIGFPDRFERP